jgi:hypothetical protein
MYLIRRSAWSLVIILLLGVPASAQRLDLDNPEGAVKAMRKLMASLEDGKPALYWWQGNVYSRVPGEKDRLLFTYHGMNVRASKTISDEEHGYGYRHVSRELLIYMDPKTKEVLRTWKNPWTGKEVEVVHVANDPVNSRPTYAKGPRGPFHIDMTFIEGWGSMSFEVPLFYTNPLAGDYQDFVGGQYQAMEIFNFFFDEEDLLGPSNEAENVSVSWARISQWLPWMEMGDRVGQIIINGAGRRLAQWDQLPESLRKEIDLNYPEYKTPPPLDDDRPNETSWTVFKEHIDAKRKEKK